MFFLFVAQLDFKNIASLRTFGFLKTMPFVFLTFRCPLKRPNDFQGYGSGLIICTANSLAAFAMSGPNFILYRIIWTTNDLYLSMYVGYFILILLRVIPVAPCVYWNLTSLPVNVSYPSTNLLTYLSMVIFAYGPLVSRPHSQ